MSSRSPSRLCSFSPSRAHGWSRPAPSPTWSAIRAARSTCRRADGVRGLERGRRRGRRRYRRLRQCLSPGPARRACSCSTRGGSATSSPAGTWARGRDRTAHVAGETGHGVAAVERTRSTFVERRRTGRVVVTNHVIAALKRASTAFSRRRRCVWCSPGRRRRRTLSPRAACAPDEQSRVRWGNRA